MRLYRKNKWKKKREIKSTWQSVDVSDKRTVRPDVHLGIEQTLGRLHPPTSFPSASSEFYASSSISPRSQSRAVRPG